MSKKIRENKYLFKCQRQLSECLKTDVQRQKKEVRNQMLKVRGVKVKWHTIGPTPRVKNQRDGAKLKALIEKMDCTQYTWTENFSMPNLSLVDHRDFDFALCLRTSQCTSL